MAALNQEWFTPDTDIERYWIVFASICEHASGAFIFARTRSDQFCHAGSEHFRNYKKANREHFRVVNFPQAGISLLFIHSFIFIHFICHVYNILQSCMINRKDKN